MAKSKATQRYEKAQTAGNLLREAQQLVQELFDEVDEQFGALSEKAQEGDKGIALEEQRTVLEDIVGNIETEADNIEGAFEEA